MAGVFVYLRHTPPLEGRIDDHAHLFQADTEPTISTAELDRAPDRPGVDRSSTSGRSRPTTAGDSAVRLEAGTSRAPSRSRSPGSPASTQPRSSGSSTKGIVAERDVVVYGYGGRGVPRLERGSTSSARRRPRPTSRAGAAWAADEQPAAGSAAQLREARPHRMAARAARRRRPEAAPAGRSSCCSMSTSEFPRSTRRATSRGALYLDTNWLEIPPTGTAARPQELEATLRALGISHDTTVVLYGRDTDGNANEKWPGRRAGQISATRAAAILMYAGVDGRPAPRRRLRLVGDRAAIRWRSSPAHPTPSRASASRSRSGPSSSSTSTRPSRSWPIRTGPRW